jgi:hypothetical protein
MTSASAALRNGDFTVVTLTAGVSPVPRNRASLVHVCACPN